MCNVLSASLVSHAPNLEPRLATPAEDAGALFFLAVASTLSLVIATEGCFVSHFEADRRASHDFCVVLKCETSPQTWVLCVGRGGGTYWWCSFKSRREKWVFGEGIGEAMDLD
jgi:hypothetical protein